MRSISEQATSKRDLAYTDCPAFFALEYKRRLALLFQSSRFSTNQNTIMQGSILLIMPNVAKRLNNLQLS